MCFNWFVYLCCSQISKRYDAVASRNMMCSDFPRYKTHYEAVSVSGQEERERNRKEVPYSPLLFWSKEEIGRDGGKIGPQLKLYTFRTPNCVWLPAVEACYDVQHAVTTGLTWVHCCSSSLQKNMGHVTGMRRVNDDLIQRTSAQTPTPMNMATQIQLRIMTISPLVINTSVDHLVTDVLLSRLQWVTGGVERQAHNPCSDCSKTINTSTCW